MSTNPYQTPETQLAIDDQALGEVKIFSPSSRINRLRYWAHAMVFTFASIALYIVAVLVAIYGNFQLGIALGALVFIATIALSFMLMIQRLHDLNKSGWMCLLMLVPFANLYLLVLLIFFEGTKGRNNFGLQTPPNQTWHWIMAFSMLIFFAVMSVVVPMGAALYSLYSQPIGGYDASAYEQPQTDPAEAAEDGAIDDTLFSDEALEDGISYETPEEEIVEDEVIDASDATEAETPQ